ncbi:hypothetical protein LWI29_009907 [Acer saccharum]|uniref:Uncharacterized protein n=1 Tax=Acer saccharum TaxID=4024 RepID=A0AA39T3Q8_ACESA|nr:hypothetical protein LWI29_009907 [Acer saccharum]
MGQKLAITVQPLALSPNMPPSPSPSPLSGNPYPPKVANKRPFLMNPHCSGVAEKSGNNGKVVGNGNEGRSVGGLEQSALDVEVLVNNTFSSSNCHNGKVVFTEITNQHGRLSEENARNFLTGTKKIFRRKDKPIMGGSQSVSVPSYHKGSTSAKGSVPNPVSKSVVEENVDSASVLRQLHIDVQDFEVIFVENNEITQDVNQGGPDSNFELVASKLKEALTVISE